MLRSSVEIGFDFACLHAIDTRPYASTVKPAWNRTEPRFWRTLASTQPATLFCQPSIRKKLPFSKRAVGWVAISCCCLLSVCATLNKKWCLRVFINQGYVYPNINSPSLTHCTFFIISIIVTGWEGLKKCMKEINSKPRDFCLLGLTLSQIKVLGHSLLKSFGDWTLK